MTRRIIATPEAPRASAVYSQAVEAGGVLYISGQLGIDPGTGTFVPGGTAAEATQALTNLGAVLRAAGLGYGDIAKATCFLADIADFAAFNEAYARFFTDAPPARSTFQVAALPLGARVEIEAIAVRSERS
jgi:2-iminobutanoate/2-iminopropanoate deaminase